MRYRQRAARNRLQLALSARHHRADRRRVRRSSDGRCGLADDPVPRQRRRQRALRADADARVTAGFGRSRRRTRNRRGNRWIIYGRFAPYREHASRAVQDVHQTAGDRGLPRGAAGGSAVTRLVLTDFRNYRSARLDLDTEPGGADRTERRRQDESARGDVVPVSRPRAAQCPARRDRPPRRDAAAPASGGGGAVAATVRGRGIGDRSRRLGTGREPELPVASAARSASTASRRAASRRSAERLGVLWLTPQMDRLFVEGPAGGAAFSTGSSSASTRRMPRGSAATSRPCANARGCCARAGRPGLARRARRDDGDSRASRWRRRGATRSNGSTMSAPSAGGLSARPGRRRRHGRRLARTEMPALAAEDRLRAALAEARRRRRGVGRRRGRAAPLRSRRDPCRKGYRRRKRLDRRAEGAADRDRAGAGASCSARSAASRRCCCSTRSTAHLDAARRAALFEIARRARRARPG